MLKKCFPKWLASHDYEHAVQLPLPTAPSRAPPAMGRSARSPSGWLKINVCLLLGPGLYSSAIVGISNRFLSYRN